MRFAPDFLDEIRARVPISSIVGKRVVFDRKKSNAPRGDFWACCPFHREKTPSFHCDDGRGRYHCFGCGASGDVFRFLTELEGISFTQAVEQLASLAGVELPKQDEKSAQIEQERASLHEVLEQATCFFEQNLRQPQARGTREYLFNRGLNEALIHRFRLGLATDNRYQLRDHLAKSAIGLEAMERAGLVINANDGEAPYDRFRNRIMFPILDLKNRVVGFGGRALSQTARAKYLNSPETELFHKGNMLYNLNAAMQALRHHKAGGTQAKPLIVVEGYMDVIALTGAGFETSVAPLGTALTSEQLQLLWRFCPQPVMCFDGDRAGFNAALRALDNILPLMKTGFSAQFMLLPSGQDPDDLVREGGGQAFASLLTQALPLAELLWRRETMGKSFNTPEQRASLEKSLKNSIFMITDESLRHYYLQDMRQRLRNLFAASFAPARGRYGVKGSTGGDKEYGGRAGFRPGAAGLKLGAASGLMTSRMVHAAGLPLREAAILVMLANHPSLWEENFDTLDRLEISNASLLRLYRIMLDVLAEWQPQDGLAMRQLLIKRGEQALLEEIDVMMSNLGLRTATVDAPLEDVRTALNQALHLHMRAHTLHKKMREIEAELLENPLTQHFAMLADVKAELEQTDATQALIEGFGT